MENKAYSRWIFFNLRPNEIARIIEHMQKGTFVPTRGANVYKKHNLSNFLQKEVPMGSETCLKNSDEWGSLTFRAKKSCLSLKLRVLRASWRKRGVFFGFPRSLRAVWVIMCPTRAPNDKIMTVLVNISPFYGSPWKYFIFLCAFCLIAPKFLVLYRRDIVSTYILTDARNALLFLAFTRMSYSMPSGENKENKAYSRWIFFNLRTNEIARIIEHL